MAQTIAPEFATLIADLGRAIGPKYVLWRVEELMMYEFDGSALDLARPDIVVVPASTEEIAAVVKIAAAAGFPIVARGGGTGLSGGSVPAAGGVVVATSRMQQVLHVDPVARTAIVQPGLINTELSEYTLPWGLHFAPDPSSQKASTIGGNSAENAGGPHCLKYGITTNHVLAATVVLADGSIVHIDTTAPDRPGYDLLGVIVGSEGTLGMVTEITVRLTPNPEGVKTFLAIFDDLDSASDTVSAIVAQGVIPAALEMLEGQGIALVEQSVHAGYPLDAQAVLLIEIDGTDEEIEDQTARIEYICRHFEARELRAAKDDEQRKKLWAGRKGALAACARLAPHYHIQDGVVPRSRLTEVLQLTREVAKRQRVHIVNIFHAGDGNLHPLILFDIREPGIIDRAIAASEEIMRECIRVGGSISGEHGIGIEKRDYMSLLFNEDDLWAMRQLRACFDAVGVMNPCKLIPTGASCGDIKHARGAAKALAAGAWI
jgi:glycolate oxidase